MLYAGNLRAVADLFAGAPLNTDDHPYIEFLAPRLTRVNVSNNTDWFTGETLGVFYETLDKREADTDDPWLPASKEITAGRRAGTALYQYTLAAARKDEAAAARYQSEVSRLVPEVVLAGAPAKSQNVPEGSAQELARLVKQQELLRHQLEEMQRRLNNLAEPDQRKTE
jgi:hypothetical protein